MGAGSSLLTTVSVGFEGVAVSAGTAVIASWLGVGVPVGSTGCEALNRGIRIKKSTASRMAPAANKPRMIHGDNLRFAGSGGEIATRSSSTAVPEAAW